MVHSIGSTVQILGQEGKIGEIVGTPYNHYNGGTKHNRLGFYTVKVEGHDNPYFAEPHEIRTLNTSYNSQLSDVLTQDSCEV